jgi:hypothetical protein
MAAVPQFDGDANPLLRGQLRIEKRIGLVGFSMAVEDPNHLLHTNIIGLKADHKRRWSAPPTAYAVFTSSTSSEISTSSPTITPPPSSIGL